MVAKELIDVRWKALIGGLLVVAISALVTLSYGWIRTLLADAATSRLPDSLRTQLGLVLGNFDVYIWSQWFAKNGQMLLGGLAGFLGGGLIAGEASKGTSFFLLSKPVSRERILLTKYALSAVVLLGVTLLGSLALLVVAPVQGHPQSVGGVLIATLLLWLGTMFVLGLALLFSVIFDDILRPVAFALIIAVLVGIPSAVGFFLPSWSDWSLPNYWASLPAYLGTTFPAKELAVCLVAAVLPVAVALPVFRKRQY